MRTIGDTPTPYDTASPCSLDERLARRTYLELDLPRCFSYGASDISPSDAVLKELFPDFRTRATSPLKFTETFLLRIRVSF
jgi:hypothetical protein